MWRGKGRVGKSDAAAAPPPFCCRRRLRGVQAGKQRSAVFCRRSAAPIPRPDARRASSPPCRFNAAASSPATIPLDARAVCLSSTTGRTSEQPPGSLQWSRERKTIPHHHTNNHHHSITTSSHPVAQYTHLQSLVWLWRLEKHAVHMEPWPHRSRERLERRRDRAPRREHVRSSHLSLSFLLGCFCSDYQLIDI